MPLSGTFDTVQLCDLMQWIHTSAMTGTLTISLDLDETYLVFREGALVALSSDDPLRLDLGQVLLSQHLVSEEQLNHTLSTANADTSLAEALVKNGIVAESVIRQAQARHAFETVLDLFFHDEGSFHFSKGESSHTLLPPPEIPQTSFLKKPIPLNKLIFEGMHRLDEWDHIRKVFPNSYVIVQAIEGHSENPIWQKLREINRPISVGELCLRMGGSRFGVYKALFDAYQQGLVGLDLMPTGEVREAILGPADMLLQNARLLLSEQQFDEARAVLSTAANLDPNNKEARRLLKQSREAQLEYLYQQVPPHLIPVLNIPREQLSEFRLNPRETYLASRLDGRWDVATLVVITPLGELETLRILHKLLHAGIARFGQ